MIVHSKDRKLTNSPPCMSILGVQFNQVLSYGSHVQAVMGKAARSMYYGALSCGARCIHGTLRELPLFHNNMLVQLELGQDS